MLLSLSEIGEALSRIDVDILKQGLVRVYRGRRDEVEEYLHDKALLIKKIKQTMSEIGVERLFDFLAPATVQECQQYWKLPLISISVDNPQKSNGKSRHQSDEAQDVSDYDDDVNNDDDDDDDSEMSNSEQRRIQWTLENEAKRRGLDVFLRRTRIGMLRKFCAEMNIAFGARQRQESLADTIIDEAMMCGTEAYFYSLPLKLLQAHCAALLLTLSDDRAKLVERIMQRIFSLDARPAVVVRKSGSAVAQQPIEIERARAAARQQRRRAVKVKDDNDVVDDNDGGGGDDDDDVATNNGRSKKRRLGRPRNPARKRLKLDEIVPNITRTALHRGDTETLRAYCRNNKLPVTGSKLDLVHRVHSHAAGAPPSQRGARRRRGPYKKKRK
jgi:hypothetical protein